MKSFEKIKKETRGETLKGQSKGHPSKHVP